MVGKWSKSGILGDHLVSESYRITNTYVFDDKDYEVVSIELLSSTFNNIGIGHKVHIDVNGDKVIVSGNDSHGAFENMSFIYQDTKTQRFYKAFNVNEIPLEAGIELIKFSPPSPTFKIADVNFKIHWKHTIRKMELDPITNSEVEVISYEYGNENNGFQIRVLYDNSIAGDIIRDIINKRKDLNKELYGKGSG